MKKVILNMNELKKYKVIKLVNEDRKSKKRAAVELNLTIRHINRLLNAYHKEGKKAFSHRNRNKSVKHAVPQEVKQKIINIYQALPIPMNFVHFTEHLEERYQIVYSDTTIRKISL
nr:helix-turn-helix domain-containing protein [Enterococcus cecorum]